MENMINQFSKAIEVKKIKDNEYQLISKATFENDAPFEVYLMRDAKNLTILTDKRRTLKYMDEFYELASMDVKNAIEAITKLYGIKLFKDALVLKISEDDDILERYFTFIQCVGQLANMFVFFDAPKEEE